MATRKQRLRADAADAAAPLQKATPNATNAKVKRPKKVSRGK